MGHLEDRTVAEVEALDAEPRVLAESARGGTPVLEPDRLRFLADAGEILESSLDYETTLRQLGHFIVPGFADWFSVDLVDEDGRVTNLGVSHVDPTKVALAEELRRRYPPSADGGVVQVARTGTAEWHHEIPDALLEASIEDEELLEIIRSLGLRSSITVPLSARGRSFGAISMIAAASGRLYDAADVTFARELGKRAGLAIENASVLMAERRANDRLRMVGRVSALLSMSLDPEEAFAKLAELLTEDLADFCLIDVRDDAAGSIRRVSVIHTDPSKQHIVEGLWSRPPDPAGVVPAAVAMRTRTTLVEDVRDDVIAAMAADEAHLDLISQIGGVNFVAAPFVTRGKVLGAMTVSSTRRRYEDDDVELINEVAARAAMHLDNARLYAAERDAARQARRLLSIVDATLSGTSLEDLLQGLLERVREELETDLAAVLLMDESDPILRIRASLGLEREIRDAVAVPVGAGFAGRIASTRRPLVVDDVSRFDPVSRYLHERVRSIVGVPLVVEGNVIGVMHTSSVQARAFDGADVALLELAAERAAVAIRRAELYERQQEIASFLQGTLAPAALPRIPGLEVAALFRAAGRGIEAGGDFYDVFRRDQSSWGIVIGDVCGRGPPAAAVTSLVRGAIRALAIDDGSPAEVLRRANDTMLRSSIDRFCTAVYAAVTPAAGGMSITVARAGHPAPLVVRTGGGVDQIRPGGALLGVFPCLEYQQVDVRLAPGDVIVLYSDGLVERSARWSAPGALQRDLAGMAGLPAAALVRHLADGLDPGPTGELRDDVVVLAARALTDESETDTDGSRGRPG